MRKWKDDGSHIIKPTQRKIYLIIGCMIIARPFITILTTGRFDGFDIWDVCNIILGTILIWGVKFNGFYKIARLYTEWRLKTKDNKFRYYSN